MQSVAAPGASVVTGHLTPGASSAPAGAACASVTPTLCRVRLPLLKTWNVYGICWPTLDTIATFDDFKRTLSEQNKALLQNYVAMRTELEKIVKDDKVKLNPRYGAQQVALLSAQSADGNDVPLVVLTLGGDDAENPYVTDVSTVTTVA